MKSKFVVRTVREDIADCKVAFVTVEMGRGWKEHLDPREALQLARKLREAHDAVEEYLEDL